MLAQTRWSAETRRLRRWQPDLLLAGGAQLLGLWPIHCKLIVEHHTIAGSAFARYQPLPEFARNQFGIAFERISPATPAPGDVMQAIACIDGYVIALGGHDCSGAVGADQNLAAATAG